MKKQDAEDLFDSLVGTVWGLAHDTNFDLTRFNIRAKYLKNKYLSSSNLNLVHLITKYWKGDWGHIKKAQMTYNRH